MAAFFVTFRLSVWICTMPEPLDSVSLLKVNREPRGWFGEGLAYGQARREARRAVHRAHVQTRGRRAFYSHGDRCFWITFLIMLSGSRHDTRTVFFEKRSKRASCASQHNHHGVRTAWRCCVSACVSCSLRRARAPVGPQLHSVRRFEHKCQDHFGPGREKWQLEMLMMAACSPIVQSAFSRYRFLKRGAVSDVRTSQ